MLQLQFFRDIAAAVMILTRIPIKWSYFSEKEPDISQSLWAYPVVGIIISIFSICVYLVSVSLGWPVFVSSASALLVTVLITGAFHEDGLADVCDGFWGGYTKDRKLEIMKDSRVGTYGVLALLFSLALRIMFLSSLATYEAISALIITACVSRTIIVSLLTVMKPAVTDGMGVKAGKPSIYSLCLSITISVVTTYFLAGVGVTGLVISVSVLALLFVRFVALRHIGGYTGDVLGAGQQVSEIFIYAALATLVVN